MKPTYVDFESVNTSHSLFGGKVKVFGTSHGGFFEHCVTVKGNVAAARVLLGPKGTFVSIKAKFT